MDFVVGANLPWLHYGIDFGANPWCPHGGIAQTSAREELDRAFEALHASGVRDVRWFLLCDGRAGIRYSESGCPLEPDAALFRDIDAALDAASRYGMRVMFVLLDFHWCAPARIVKGVQLGGRAEALASDSMRGSLVDFVLRPIVERYGREPVIAAWDIINEPEWIDTIGAGTIQQFVAETAAMIHDVGRQPVTVGSAGLRWVHRYRDLGLDFYQVHWYDRLNRPKLETPVASLDLDRPVLLGEFPTRGSNRTPQQILDAARSAGYSGAFYWSALSADESSARLAFPKSPAQLT